jgi:hypothetical protein
MGNVLVFTVPKVDSARGRCRRTGKFKPEATELAAYFDVLSRLEGNNARLCALGEAPLNPGILRSPGDMDSEELCVQIEQIDCLIGHQQQKLDAWRAAAAARRNRTVSSELPTAVMEIF